MAVWATEQLTVMAEFCICSEDILFSLVLEVVEDGVRQVNVSRRRPARGKSKSKKTRKRKNLHSESDPEDEVDRDAGEEEAEPEEESVDKESSDAEADEDSSEEKEPSESEILSFVCAASKPLTLQKDFAVEKNLLQLGDVFPRSRIKGASWLASKKVRSKIFWEFASDWEQRKTDTEGDKKASKLLGRECRVQHETYKMGQVRVRSSLPREEVFENSQEAVIHGHVACYNLEPEPKASQDTLDWGLDSNVFVSSEGVDLENFSGALKYWKETQKDVYIFYEVLRTT
jgi:hypothetical protein